MAGHDVVLLCASGFKFLIFSLICAKADWSFSSSRITGWMDEEVLTVI